MANANNSIITGKLSGSLGKEIVFRQWDGASVAAKYPKPAKGEPTPAQVAMREKFQDASRYAKAVIKNPDPTMAQAYAAALKPRQNVFARAAQDYMKAPVVKKIITNLYSGAPGDTITVQAFDDFRVVRVRVEIYEPSGLLAEFGNAIQDLNGLNWTYTAQSSSNIEPGMKIKAIATDVPGNEGSFQVTF